MKRCVLALFAAIATVITVTPSAAWCEENEIPIIPSAPPALFRRTPPEIFRCQRTFIYDGKTYGCDSNVRPDGEGLRPFLESVPQASSELNVYQRRRTALQNMAYVGSLGLVVLIAGLVGGGGTGKEAMILSGSSIFGGGLIYGFTSARTNENNLSEAVRLHNDAVPTKPIDLQFSTGISF